VTVRRVGLTALGALAVLSLAAASPAAAGTFRVAQCNAVAGGGLSPRGFQAGLWSVDNGWPMVECGAGGGAVRIGTGNWRLLDRQDTTTRFALPGSMPQTTARTAWLDWRFNPQSPSTNPAYLIATASGARLFEANAGEGTMPGGAMRRDLPAGARGLELMVWCSPVNGPGWCNWPGHLLELRGLEVELEESGEPSGSAAGALVGPSQHEGVEPLEVAAADGDSGVRRVAVSLGGVAVGTLTPADDCRDDHLPPCPQSLRGVVDVDTRLVPDGPRRLRLVVTDAAGNARTIDAATVQVANQPQIDTPAGPDTGVGSGGGASSPVAPAPASPVPAGSAAPPARQFPPNPLAGRGHVPNGRNASEHAWIDAWLEPRRGASGAPLRRRTATVPYGVRVRIRGRLTDERGRPIARAALAAVRREPGRPWRLVTGVRTRADGHFTAFTRIGPSQAVRFVYYAYGDSPRGRRSAPLRVRVR